MSEPLTVEEFAKKYGKKKGRNKYNVSKPEARTYAGKVYDSKAEMLYAQCLWERLRAADLLEVVEQPRIYLGVIENIYVPDFLVITPRESYYVDVKGVETPQFKKVKKLWAAYGRLPLKIVTLKGQIFHVNEIILPPSR